MFKLRTGIVCPICEDTFLSQEAVLRHITTESRHVDWQDRCGYGRWTRAHAFLAGYYADSPDDPMWVSLCGKAHRWATDYSKLQMPRCKRCEGELATWAKTQDA